MLKPYENDEARFFSYFAAHAPKKIPKWFRYKSQLPIPLVPNKKIGNPKWQSRADDWSRDACFDLADIETENQEDIALLKNYSDQWNKYYNDSFEYKRKREEEFYFAWRCYYAQKMVDLAGKQIASAPEE
jgi:phage terminase small subunit